VVASAAACAVVASTGALTPADPLAMHWSYAALNLPAAWDIETGSPEIVIAVIDSGVDATHPDLAGAVAEGYDFVNDRIALAPVDGHGTGVAGTAAARADNGVGGVGACFECKVLPLQVINDAGIAVNSHIALEVHIARAIDYAVDHGAAVVNVSLGSPNSPPELERAIARARVAGVLVVASAGNESSDTPQYPAAVPGTVSVGASTYSQRRATFSNHGSWVRFAAPECAPIAVLGGGHRIGCGTSFSSPLVAGVIALVRAHAPFATADDIEAWLARSARAVPGTLFGIPDAAEVLRLVGSPEARLRPVILGSAAVGSELEAFSGIWAGSGLRVNYAWDRCRRGTCTSIAGATSASYTPTEEDRAHRLRAVVSADGLSAAASAQTRVVESRPRLLVRPTVAGKARVGARLTVHLGRWMGENILLTTTWQHCARTCEQVAVGQSYRVRPSDRGHRLRALVQAANSVGTGAAASTPTRVVR
jgi:subtilisin family serine protease